MATERNVVDFKIHNLTEEQFQELKEQGKIDPNAVYCTPDTTKERLDALEENKQDKGDYATNTALSQGLSQKQDIATAVNYDNITNCITEIPQDIQLELADGVLTLKAGSKVYVPNGTGVFDVITTKNDLTVTASTNGTHLIGLSQGFGSLAVYINAVSGTTEPTLSNGLTWYDTANNVIKRAWGGSWQNSLFSLPFAVVTVSNGAMSSVDQVFNGFGYIGSTVFALPGVKGLVPNGRNEDGTLKNVSSTTQKVIVTTKTADGNYDLVLENNFLSAGINVYSYDKQNNINTWYGNKSLSYYIGSAVISGGKFVSLKTKPTFHAVDYSDVVHNNGDETVAGTKTFTDTVKISGQTLTFTDLALSTYKEIDAYSDTGKLIGSVRFENSGAANAVRLVSSKQDGSEGATLAVITANDGSPRTIAVTPNNSSNSVDIATTAFVKSVLTGNDVGLAKFSKAQNGYYKFSNGLIIQWGRIAAEVAGSTGSVTFPTPFTSDNASVQIEIMAASNGKLARVTSITKTGFGYEADQFGSPNPTAEKTWMAIGY